MAVPNPMKWTIREQLGTPNAGLANLDLDPVVVALLMRRDVVDRDMVERFFMPDYDRHLHDRRRRAPELGAAGRAFPRDHRQSSGHQ